MIAFITKLLANCYSRPSAFQRSSLLKPSSGFSILGDSPIYAVGDSAGFDFEMLLRGDGFIDSSWGSETHFGHMGSWKGFGLNSRLADGIAHLGWISTGTTLESGSFFCSMTKPFESIVSWRLPLPRFQALISSWLVWTCCSKTCFFFSCNSLSSSLRLTLSTYL